MKVIYIGAPFTGETTWDVERNVRIAERAALKVAKIGAMPLCPHTNSRFFHGQCTHEFWYDGTLELLRRCDAVLFVGKWWKSKGCIAERDCAVSHHMPVFTHVSDLASWLVVNSIGDMRVEIET